MATAAATEDERKETKPSKPLRVKLNVATVEMARRLRELITEHGNIVTRRCYV